jgi:MEMO1 family protein
MDRPRLRPLEAFPIDRKGQKLLGLRDPSGLSEAVATLPPAAVAVIQLCDGDSTRDEICAEFQRRYNSPLTRDTLDKLLDQLDQALLLDTDRFRQHSAKIFGEFAQSPTRPAHLAGKSYPAGAAELVQQLDSFFTNSNGPGTAVPNARPLPKAIVAPHIDFNRGGPAYAWAYKPLVETQETPELIVVFGTDHNGAEQPFTFTRKHYQTPLGQMTTDVALVDALVEKVKGRIGENAAHQLFYDEHHHRGEHSIEFQMVWLRYIYKERADGIRVLPILCGSLHEYVERNLPPRSDGKLDFVLATLRELTQDRKTLFIAGADLAHVGPRFGDKDALDADDRESLEKRDQQTLLAAGNGDAEAWFGEIQREKDRRRVCGLPPIFAMLETARPGKGELLAYAQCPADDDGGSLVSIASMVYG